MSHRDMAVLQAVIVDEKTKVETSAGLGVSRHILDGHLTTAVYRLRAEVAPAESDDTPLKRSRWWKKYKSFDGLHRRNCERVYNKPAHDELPFRDVTYPHRNIYQRNTGHSQHSRSSGKSLPRSSMAPHPSSLCPSRRDVSARLRDLRT